MLHAYTNVSTFDASLYFFAYCHRFKLSMKAQEELLNLIHFLLPFENNFPKTINKMKLEIGLDNIELNTKEYCERCKVLLQLNIK